MDAGVEARLQAGDVTFDSTDAELLYAIAEHGSVYGASNALGRSRARALNRVKELENAIGPLVERQRGGSEGGGSRLTTEARTLLARFERLRATLSGTAGSTEAVLRGKVVERDGELGLVETEAGSVLAVLVDTTSTNVEKTDPEEGPPDSLQMGEQVQVSIRADTVTLHDPADAPDSGATSARNRFAGTVTQIDSGESIARVEVDIGAGEPLSALLTQESLDRLELEPGDDIVTSFKATVTRATTVE